MQSRIELFEDNCRTVEVDFSFNMIYWKINRYRPTIVVHSFVLLTVFFNDKLIIFLLLYQDWTHSETSISIGTAKGNVLMCKLDWNVGFGHWFRHFATIYGNFKTCYGFHWFIKRLSFIHQSVDVIVVWRQPLSGCKHSRPNQQKQPPNTCNGWRLQNITNGGDWVYCADLQSLIDSDVK